MMQSFMATTLVVLCACVCSTANAIRGRGDSNPFAISTHYENQLYQHQPWSLPVLFELRGGADDAALEGEEEEEEEDATTAIEEANAAEEQEQDAESIQEDEDLDEEDDDEEEEEDTITSTATTASETATTATLPEGNSTELRLLGKEAHDEGDFALAATLFGQAAELLRLEVETPLEQEEQDDIDDEEEEAIEGEEAEEVDADDNDDDDADDEQPPLTTTTTTTQPQQEQSEEYATCRMHQALCYLKVEDYEDCVEVCNELLDNFEDLAPAIQARAHFRRAKAFLGLGDQMAALQDARAASFLGDRKAVQLYGKLMRESSPLPGDIAESMSSLGDLFSPSLSSSSSFSDTSSTALLESLLSKSGSDDSSGAGLLGSLMGMNSNDKDGSGGVGGLLSGLGGGSGKKGNSLATSVLKSMSKRLDDDATHTTISTFLQSADKAKLEEYASMAGMQVSDSNLERIEQVCQGVTPKTIKRTVSIGKIFVYLARIINRIGKFLRKYRFLFIILAVLQWTKSAILRPVHIDPSIAQNAAKAAAKQQQRAAKAAAKQQQRQQKAAKQGKTNTAAAGGGGDNNK